MQDTFTTRAGGDASHPLGFPCVDGLMVWLLSARNGVISLSLEDKRGLLVLCCVAEQL